MAETAIPVDAMQCLGLRDAPSEYKDLYEAVSQKVHPSDGEKLAIRDFFDHGRRVQGQTSDNLRSLGIKILHEALPILIRHPLLDGLLHKKSGWEEPDWGEAAYGP
jgi:hypothetical protein